MNAYVFATSFWDRSPTGSDTLDTVLGGVIGIALGCLIVCGFWWFRSRPADRRGPVRSYEESPEAYGPIPDELYRPGYDRVQAAHRGLVRRTWCAPL